MSLLSPELEAKGYALALNMLAPAGNARVTEVPGGFLVAPDAAQARFMREVLERKLTKKASSGIPGVSRQKVKLDLSPVYMPIVLKRVIPIALVLLVGGYVLGKVT